MKNGTLKMFMFGIALAIVFATVIARISPSALSDLPVKYLVGALVVAVSWRLFYRKPRPKNPQLDPNTRAWARAVYFNGLISLEELNQFYATHPEEDDNGKPSKRP